MLVTRLVFVFKLVLRIRLLLKESMLDMVTRSKELETKLFVDSLAMLVLKFKSGSSSVTSLGRFSKELATFTFHNQCWVLPFPSQLLLL